jgi:hypothetical protein
MDNDGPSVFGPFVYVPVSELHSLNHVEIRIHWEDIPEWMDLPQPGHRPQDHKSKESTYCINDHGKQMLTAVVEKKNLRVYNRGVSLEHPIYDIAIKQLWLGNDNSMQSNIDEPRGNSLLAHLSKDQYVFIGESVYEFRSAPDDSILEFHSPVDKNKVSKPYAIGKKFTYFFVEGVYKPNTGSVSKPKHQTKPIRKHKIIYTTQ